MATAHSGQQIEEFVAHLPVDKCARRLENQHEPPTLWAWDWQYRLWVEVQEVDPLTYRFTLRRVQRSALELRIAYVSVRGYLRALDAERTAVIAEARYAGVAMLLLSLLTGVMFTAAFTPALGITHVAMREAVLLVVLATALAGGTFALMWLWAASQVRKMIGTLREVLVSFEFGVVGEE